MAVKDDSGTGDKVEWRPVLVCAVWTALWLIFTIWVIVGSWSTLETLQAKAADTTTTVVAPTPTPSTVPSPLPSPTPSGSPSATSSPASPGTPPGNTSKSAPAATFTAAPGGPEQAEIPLIGGHVMGSLDLGMFLFALAFGGLGATAHCLYYFTGAVGNKSSGFGWDRLGWFGPQPILGAILAALLYVVIRGGLLSTSSGASAVNMFGVAAIGALAGLSARKAYQLLLSSSFLGGTGQQNNTSTTGQPADTGAAAPSAGQPADTGPGRVDQLPNENGN